MKTLVLEAALEQYFSQKALAVGGQAIKMIPYINGVPDRILMMPGNRTYYVELKADNGTVSAIQSHRHRQLWERFGIRVWVVYGREGVDRLLRRILDEIFLEEQREQAAATELARLKTKVREMQKELKVTKTKR